MPRAGSSNFIAPGSVWVRVQRLFQLVLPSQNLRVVSQPCAYRPGREPIPIRNSAPSTRSVSPGVSSSPTGRSCAMPSKSRGKTSGLAGNPCTNCLAQRKRCAYCVAPVNQIPPGRASLSPRFVLVSEQATEWRESSSPARRGTNLSASSSMPPGMLKCRAGLTHGLLSGNARHYRPPQSRQQ